MTDDRTEGLLDGWVQLDRTPLSHHAIRNEFARGLVVDRTRAGWLGRLALDLGLDHLIDDIYDRPEQVQGAIWRAHHARDVVSASPVALDLLDSRELELVCALERVGSELDWREWICGAPPAPALSRRSTRPGGPAIRSRAAEEQADRRRFLEGDVEIRECGDERGALGLRFSSRCLEVGAELFGGLVTLRTWEGDVWLETSLEFPDAVRAAAVGRGLDRVFDHPVLRDRGYVVATSTDLGPYSGQSVWRLGFRAEPVAWRPPWAGQARQAASSGRPAGARPSP